jgi:hypothetical protein
MAGVVGAEYQTNRSDDHRDQHQQQNEKEKQIMRIKTNVKAGTIILEE